jgi:uncharacterized membrane protein
MEMMIFNVVLTGLVAAIGVMAKTKFDHVEKLSELLNKTREEVARNHITREEYSRDLEKLGDRIDTAIHRLEAKIDMLSGK